MMRVVVPAVPAKLHPAVVPAILRAGYAPTVHDVSADERAYWRLLRDQWETLTHDVPALCIVEHDVEVAEGQLAELERCPEPWCAYSYPVYWGNLADTYGGAWGLGCAKFTSGLAHRFPDLLAVDVPKYRAGAEDLTGTHWRYLDAAIAQWLRGPYQVTVHRHYPDVIHHHDYDYLGAWLPPEQLAALPEGHPLKVALRQ